MTDTSRSPNTDGRVADALAAAVRDYGPSLAADPRRVQAVISDVLGSDVGTQRAELDAVVDAARHDVAAALADRRLEPAAAIARLEATGMASVFARTAVDIWLAALGTPPMPTPPTMPAPEHVDVEPVSAPAVVATPPTVLGVPAPPVAPPMAPPPMPASPTVLTTPTAPGRRFNPAIGLAGVGVIALVVALVAVLVTRGGPDTPDTGKDPKVTEAPELAFPATDTDIGKVTRLWTVDDGTFTGKVAVANTTDAPVSGRHVEVIPKSLATDGAQVTFAPEVAEVIAADPIVAWAVTDLGPGEKVTFTYTIDVPEDAGADDLATWKADYEAALADYLAKVGATPPSLTVSSPADGATHDGADVNVVGTTDPGATITVDGVPTPVNPDGTWIHHKEGLTPGANQIVVVATGTNGATTPTTVNLSYLPPVTPPPTTTPVVTPPVRPPTGSPSTTVKPTTPTAPRPTQPPATPAPTTAPPTTSPPTTTPRRTPTAATGTAYGVFGYFGPSGYGGTVDLRQNAGGDYTNLRLVATTSANGHVNLTINSNGVVTIYPHHNGYFVDSFSYEVVDGVTGRVARGTITFDVSCNTGYGACY